MSAFGTATDSSIGPINTLNGGRPTARPAWADFSIPLEATSFSSTIWARGSNTRSATAVVPYAGLDYRPAFYDVNAVYQPFGRSRRLIPEIQGGIGRASLRFYYTPAILPRLRTRVPFEHRPSHRVPTTGDPLRRRRSLLRLQKISLSVLRWMCAGSTISIYFSHPLVPEFTVAIGYTLRRANEQHRSCRLKFRSTARASVARRVDATHHRISAPLVYHVPMRIITLEEHITTPRF